MFNQNLAAKKLEYCGKSWNLKDFHEKISITERLWRKELGLLVLALPEFTEVKHYILEKVSGSEYVYYLLSGRSPAGHRALRPRSTLGRSVRTAPTSILETKVNNFWSECKMET